jgi:hypothetical protein
MAPETINRTLRVEFQEKKTECEMFVVFQADSVTLSQI